MKVLDFSTLLPGPYATMMFADMGADVLKVESSTRPDLLSGMQATHQHLNRSKSSIALDLKKKESIEVVKKLVLDYDIVIEQFRPGVMERLGLDYESMKQVNPRLIYCSLTGYGQSGPYQNRPGHDNNYLALSGMLDYSRRKDEKPTTMGIQVADIAGGSMHAVVGILAAALHREKTGEGQHVDISMTDASFAMNAMFGPDYLVNGVEPKPEELLLNGGTFYDYYETKDGRYFSVGSLEPQFRMLLCEALQKPDLIGFAMSEKRADQQRFKEEVKATFLEKDFDEWLEVFNDDFEGCVEPVLTFAEACEHPQLKARGMIIEVSDSVGGEQKQIATPLKFSSKKPVYTHIGPQLGEHTEEVLLAHGYTKEQIVELLDNGVLC
ncbi:CaiB/BaiF CoA transferase family protein [Sporosarcina sp. Marseille-Q4063]|uniref:CaiB/BaiF CoA transferase family protein n=1 Tax=Sporosarcina sp. Marseille-Q4063 TaxID=2810514 RepID=UPI0035303255